MTKKRKRTCYNDEQKRSYIYADATIECSDSSSKRSCFTTLLNNRCEEDDEDDEDDEDKFGVKVSPKFMLQSSRVSYIDLSDDGSGEYANNVDPLIFSQAKFQKLSEKSALRLSQDSKFSVVNAGFCNKIKEKNLDMTTDFNRNPKNYETIYEENVLDPFEPINATPLTTPTTTPIPIN
jgi:hypothetical protein